MKACCNKFSTILRGHFLQNLETLKSSVFANRFDMIGKARKVATLKGEVGLCEGDHRQDFLGFLQLLMTNSGTNGLGGQFASLCNLLLSYNSRTDVVGGCRWPHRQSFAALERMQDSVQRLRRAEREKQFAAVVGALDEGELQRVANGRIGPQFLELCAGGLDGPAVAACLELGFLPGMDTNACLEEVRKALRDPDQSITPAQVGQLAQCCAEMHVVARAWRHG